MENNKLLRADYLDILFDGRNKMYGGYELRRRYAARARKATAIVILSAALVFALPVIAANLSPNKDLVPTPMTRVTALTAVPENKPILPLVKIPEPPPVAATIKAPVFKVVDDKDVAEPPKAIDDLKGKEIGFKDNLGMPGDVQPDLDGPVGKGTEKVEFPVTQEKRYVNVDQMPAFNGDLAQFLSEHLRYPDEARAAGEEGRVGIHFVVNEDGSISDVEVTNKASALLDAEAMRVVRSMPRWKPGRLDGRAVKVYFTLPITFRLD